MPGSGNLNCRAHNLKLDKVDEEDVPTQEPQAREQARLPIPHGDQRRSQCFGPPSRKRPLALDRQRQHVPQGHLSASNDLTGEEADVTAHAGSLSRQLRLSERRIVGQEMYRRVFKQGRAQRGEHLNLWLLKPTEPQEITRVGFVIRKKTGKAHLRNRLRRIFRALFQSRIPQWESPVWIVFDVPPRPLRGSIRQIRDEAESLLSHCKP